MNKNNCEKETLALLKASLKRVLKGTHENGFPYLLDICAAEEALAGYVTAFKVNCTDDRLSAGEIQFQIISPFDLEEEVNLKPSSVIALLKKQPEAVDVLLKLKRQLVFSGALSQREKAVVKKLLEQNYIVDLKISLQKRKYIYYMLSAKGRCLFENDNLYNQIKLNFPNFVVPGWMNNNCQVSVQKIIQAAILNEYLKSMDCQIYITFSFDEEEELIFASEISNNRVIKYYCVLGIEEEKDTEYLHYIKKIAEADSIGCIEIICVNVDEKIKIEDIITTQDLNLSKIKVCILEEKYE